MRLDWPPEFIDREGFVPPVATAIESVKTRAQQRTK
jgi:hypothetical protein